MYKFPIDLVISFPDEADDHRIIREFLQVTGWVLYLKSDKVNRKGERSGPCGAPMLQRSMSEACHTHSPTVTPQQVDEDQSLQGLHQVRHQHHLLLKDGVELEGLLSFPTN